MNTDEAHDALLCGAAGLVLVFMGACLVAAVPVRIIRAALSPAPLRPFRARR